MDRSSIKHDHCCRMNIDRTNQPTAYTETQALFIQKLWSKETDSNLREHEQAHTVAIASTHCQRRSRNERERENELTRKKEMIRSVEEDRLRRETIVTVNSGLIISSAEESQRTSVYLKVASRQGFVWKRKLSYPWPGYWYGDVATHKWLTRRFCNSVSALNRIWKIISSTGSP